MMSTSVSSFSPRKNGQTHPQPACAAESPESSGRQACTTNPGAGRTPWLKPTSEPSIWKAEHGQTSMCISQSNMLPLPVPAVQLFSWNAAVVRAVLSQWPLNPRQCLPLGFAVQLAQTIAPGVRWGADASTLVRTKVGLDTLQRG